VALSTSEAEYLAATECSKHISWVRAFFFDIMHQLHQPTPFYIDNTSAIFTATGDGIKSRSKHIDRRFHYIRGLIESNNIVIHHIPTEEMLADYLTKSLGPQALDHALRLNHML
jgi:hypothetical protein